jgi:hypothetical protein
MKAPFPITPALTSIALAYTNEKMIADGVLPRIPVGKQDFKYTTYALADSFNVPNTLVGRKGKPGEIEFGASELTSSTRDYGLEAPIPYADIENAAGTQFDPEGRATELLTDLILLDREQRVSSLIFDAAQYAAANKTTLAGANQWSDPSSDPIKAVLTILDGMLMRPNVGVIGRAVATQLQTHPNVVKAWNKNSGDKGKAPISFVAELMELDEILVGEGWVNSAKPGQNPSLVRLWGKHMSLFVRNKNVSTLGGVSFGYTAQWGGRIAGRKDDDNIGLRGGVRVRVGESLKELLIANDLGYLIQSAVA